MQGDAATALGIPPPHTVRITLNGTVTDWPNEMVHVQHDRIECRLPGDDTPIVHYPYAAVGLTGVAPEVVWEFYTGTPKSSGGSGGLFTVERGPAREPAANGNHASD